MHNTLCALRSALCVRSALCAMLIFTPLARGAVQGWAVCIIHLITLIALTVFLLGSFNENRKWIKTPLDRPIICLLFLCLLSSLFSMHKYTSIWSTILLLNYLTIYYLVIHTVRARSQFRRLIYLIIGIATFLSVFGLFKKFGINPFPWWEYSDLGYSPDWVSATYGSHNHLAGYLEMAIPLILGLFLTGFKGGRLILMIYLTLIMLTALVFSLSRGGWIGSFMGLAFMAFALLTSRHFKRKGFLTETFAKCDIFLSGKEGKNFNRRNTLGISRIALCFTSCKNRNLTPHHEKMAVLQRSLTAVIGGILALAFIVLTSTPVVERVRTLMEKEGEVSLHGRVVVWGGVMKMIGDHPLLGTGPGTFATIFTQYQPPGLRCRFTMAHNDYLHFISETGLMLIPIIIWMVIVLYRKGIKKLKNPSRLIRGITLGAMSGITAILVHSAADFNLHIPANALLFTVLAAIVAAPLPEVDRGQRSEVRGWGKNSNESN